MIDTRTDEQVEAHNKKLNAILSPLGWNQLKNTAYFAHGLAGGVDFSAIALDQVVAYSQRKIYDAGLDFGIKSTQRVIRNALGMEK